MFKKTPVFAALLGFAVVSTPAFAEATRVEVTYKDLDLTTAKGQRTLERRLDNAAREACGYDVRTIGTRLASKESSACYKQATAKAKNVMALAIDDAAEDTRLGG